MVELVWLATDSTVVALTLTTLPSILTIEKCVALRSTFPLCVHVSEYGVVPAHNHTSGPMRLHNLAYNSSWEGVPQRASSGAALRATERVLLLAVWIGNDTLYAEPTWKRQFP